MNTDIRLSIIIPIYKSEVYLHECVDSVLNQTYTNQEVLLVDDGSPDRCPQICDDYAKKDSRVRVIHKPNGGLSDARNAGLKIATGDYVIFLDSDDYYKHDDFLEMIVMATKGGTMDAVFFQRTVFYEESKRPNDSYPPYHIEWNKLNAASLILVLAQNDLLDASACMKATKRSILQNNDLYFKQGLFSEDVEWFSRYILFVNSVTLINKPDYFYRKRFGSITSSLTERNVRDLLYTIQQHSTKIKDSIVESDRKCAILSYHSYQYYIILGLINNVVRGEARRELLDECKKYKWLANYSISRKTKRSAMVLNLLGIELASKIFGFYIKNK
jgi:glycosyltransferase involved in cell wall biosynthesis